MTHRPHDYHPDHRYAGQLVQDATYLLTVPDVLSDTPALTVDPVVLFGSDQFQKPYPFRPDLVVDIEVVFETKLDQLNCHASQYYEWLPYHDGKLSQVPRGLKARGAWMRDEVGTAFQVDADRFRDRLISRYGAQRGGLIRYAEAYERCEYSGEMRPREEARLFPF